MSKSSVTKASPDFNSLSARTELGRGGTSGLDSEELLRRLCEASPPPSREERRLTWRLCNAIARVREARVAVERAEVALAELERHEIQR